MNDQMRIAEFAESMQTIYIGEIEQMAKHYKASPADLDADQLRAWVLHGIDRGLKPATTNVTVAALKFFYAETLGCPERVAGLRARKQPRKLPRHMAEEEVERIILATPDLRYRAAIVVAYGAGLRISETVAIKIGDTRSDEKLLHIPSGKGGTERMAPLPEAVIHYLRGYYRNIWRLILVKNFLQIRVSLYNDRAYFFEKNFIVFVTLIYIITTRICAKKNQHLSL